MSPSYLSRTAPFRFVALCRARENRPIVVALAACAALLLWKARWLHYPDLAYRYPFVMFDSFQWILDSLLYRGHDVAAVYRNPGLPLVLAALGAIGKMAWLPLATVALLGMFLAYLTLWLRASFPPLPVALTVLCLGLNFSVQTAFDLVLADQWAVTFLLAAVFHLSEARAEPRHLRAFAVWGALSFLFQYAIAALAPAAALYLVVAVWPAAADRRALRRSMLQAAGLGLALILPVFLWKAVKFGNPLYANVVQFPLVKLHFFGMVFYAFNCAAFYGLPAALLMVRGFWLGLRRADGDLLNSACILSFFGFWVLLYVWLDPRFLLYFAPFGAFCLARALDAIYLEDWLGRGASLPRLLAGWGAVCIALLLGLYEREGPYSRAELPVTPQTEVVLGIQQITEWPGNVTITLGGLHLSDATDFIPALHFVTSYYPRHRKSVDPKLDSEGAELERLHASLPAGQHLAACGHLATDYWSSMRREIALEEHLRACTPDAPLRLLSPEDVIPRGDEVLFSGSYYRVVRTHR